MIAPPRLAPVACAAADAVLAELGPIEVAATLRGAHPIVRGWLAANTARRGEPPRYGWAPARVEDLTTPLANRRLRLTSALLKALAARGLEVGEDGTWLTAGRGEDRVGFRFYARTRIEHRPADAEAGRGRSDPGSVRTSVPAGDLVLRIRDGAVVPELYRELKTPLDGQLPTIVAALEAGLAGRAERRRVRTGLAARWAAARAEQQNAEAYRRAEAGLVERLVEQAERCRQVEAIRAFIVAADGSPAVDAADYARWRAWALAQAEAMDPLRDGSVPFARLPPLSEWGSDATA